MILRCDIKLKLGDACTAYDRMATADALIKKLKYLLNQDCEKSKDQMELLSIQGQIVPQSKGDAPFFIPWDTSRSLCDPSV